MKFGMLTMGRTYSSNRGEKCISSWKPDSRCSHGTLEKMVGE
jgi:hypothetical protein